jgi:hypothetical protein
MSRSISAAAPGSRGVADDHLDDRDPAAGRHRLTTARENLYAARVIPVVHDKLQQVQVCRGHRLKEVAAHHVGAISEFGLSHLDRDVADDSRSSRCRGKR